MEIRDENIYEKLQELFENSRTNVNILQDQISIELQTEYFECARDHVKFSKGEVLKKKNDIFKKDIDTETKKRLFVQLASINHVDAYRTIEKYVESQEKELSDWAKLALQESRLLIESKLLDQNQILITTGLGGKDFKLRYFIVLIAKSGCKYEEYQKNVIEKETSYIFTKNNAEIESIEFDENLAAILALIPLEIPIQKTIEKIIQESNFYGDFIGNDFIVTNVKKMSFDEIRSTLSQKKE